MIGAIRSIKAALAQRRRAIAGRLALCALLLGGLLCAARAQSGAPDWPGTKPIHFEVVAAAGGLVDFARHVGSSHMGGILYADPGM